jgi:hypothetical protein
MYRCDKERKMEYSSQAVVRKYVMFLKEVFLNLEDVDQKGLLRVAGVNDRRLLDPANKDGWKAVSERAFDGGFS